MDEFLSDEETMIRDSVAAFVAKEWDPVVAEHFEAGPFSTNLILGQQITGIPAFR